MMKRWKKMGRLMKIQNKFILLVVLLFAYAMGYTQTKHHIKSQVVDSKTGDGVPFANVALKSDPFTGAASDDDGKFKLDVKTLNDTLFISSIGYRLKGFALKEVIGKKTLALDPVSVDLQEVVIDAGMNKAWDMLKKIHAKRAYNNPENAKNYSYRQYSKDVITFENINLSKKGTRFYKKLKNALIKVNDSLSSLPIMMNEDIAQCYINHNGLKTSRLIQEERNGVSFFESSSIKEITGKMVESTNFYNNYIAILSKYVPSPTGKHSRLYYKMYIADSLIQDGERKIKINFFPRNTQDLALNGYFWVDTKTSAIIEIYGHLLQRTNINFVRDFTMYNEYQQLSNGKWYYKRKETDVTFDYNIIGQDDEKKENVTVRVKKVRVFSDVTPDVRKEETETLSQLKSIKEGDNSELFIRPEALNASEKLIHDKINILKKERFVVIADKTINMLMNGYYEQGKIDIGPITDFYGNNLLEGYRFSFGLRTNKNLWKYNSIGGFVGYGSLDREWKYGLTYLHRFKDIGYNKLKVDFWKDVMPLGYGNLYLIQENSYSKNQDNIIASLFSVSPIRNINLQQHVSVSFEHDLKKGLMQSFKIQGNRIWDNEFVDFTKSNYLDFGEASYTIRFSVKENYFDEYFHRIYHGNRYPVIHFKVAAGKYQFNNTGDVYGKLHLQIKHRVNLGIGTFRYLITSGMIFGTVPFPLLEISRGNQTYGLLQYAFNALNYMEYASDKYAGIHGNLTMNGMLFNRIPLIKKLQLREVFSVKALWGELSEKHNKVMPYPKGLTAPSNPYLEVGAGISNLFKAFRIEYIWRLTDRNKPDISTSGIRVRLEFSF